VTKRTPREQLQAFRKDQLKRLRAEIDKAAAESVNTLRALSDRDLSLDQRLDIFKKLQAWPRIVLGLYCAELVIAQKDRKDNGTPEYGREEPSEIALRKVGEAVGLGPDRIRALCTEGRCHLEQGMPQMGVITAAKFMEMFSTVVPEDVAAGFREIYSSTKEKSLADLEERFSAGRPLL
jgi:hypothetical protein